MKSAEEYADDYFRRFVAPDEIGLYVSHPDLTKLVRAIQSDAIKACAERAVSVGRAMADGYKETSCPHCKDGQIAAGNTGALARENILSLLPKD